MRVIFMGTPDFAVSSLKALLDAGYEVIGAVTQEDRPKGRGYQLIPKNSGRPLAAAIRKMQAPTTIMIFFLTSCSSLFIAM